MKKVVVGIIVTALVVGTLLFVTLRSSTSSDKVGQGFYQGVTAQWCADHGGIFMSNVPAAGDTQLGTCDIRATP
jgi:hypothetical protein